MKSCRTCTSPAFRQGKVGGWFRFPQNERCAKDMGDFLKWWGFPNSHWVFLLKMIILGVEIGGYHHFRKHPIWIINHWTFFLRAWLAQYKSLKVWCLQSSSTTNMCFCLNPDLEAWFFRTNLAETLLEDSQLGIIDQGRILKKRQRAAREVRCINWKSLSRTYSSWSLSWGNEITW